MGSAYRELLSDLDSSDEQELPMLDATDGGTEFHPERKPAIKRYHAGYSKDVDQGWSWVILLVAFLMFMLGNGAQFAFGVMYSSIRRYFETSKSTTSWILLLQRGSGTFFGEFQRILPCYRIKEA